jgi:hypothetical protein
LGQQYPCAAWDNVGNLYGASSTRNVWRVWSPPGANTNTTTAVQQLTVGAAAFEIQNVSATSTGVGSAILTINFTAAGNPAPTAFTLLSSSTVNGSYALVVGAIFTGSSGTYQATVPVSTSPQFFIIKQ